MTYNKENPDFLNSFLQYSTVILNKSKNSIKEYNYPLKIKIVLAKTFSWFGTFNYNHFLKKINSF